MVSRKDDNMGWEITYESGEKEFISLNEGFAIIGELIGELLFDVIKEKEKAD